MIHIKLNQISSKCLTMLILSVKRKDKKINTHRTKAVHFRNNEKSKTNGSKIELVGHYQYQPKFEVTGGTTLGSVQI